MNNKSKGTYDNSNNPHPKKTRRGSYLIWVYLLLALIILGTLFITPSSNRKEVSWDQFQKMISQNLFSEITVDRNNYKAVAKVDDRKQAEVFTKEELRRFENLNFSQKYQ